MARSPKHEVEALLFSSGKAMHIDQIAELSKLSKQKVTRALKALKKDYDERDSAVSIEQDGQEWKMTVRGEFIPLVKNIVADTELSRATMETLAIIAYKYPGALQSEVVDTRGSGAYEHIKELEELGFIRKERSGRSYELKLTEKFFEYFEVSGEKDIRAAFKSVKPPDKQTKLGGMDVVDVEDKEEKEEPLEGMDVVDVGPEKHAEKESSEEEPPKVEFDESHQKFLDDLDKRIEQISGKNDEHEDDPQLKRPSDDEPEDLPKSTE